MINVISLWLIVSECSEDRAEAVVAVHTTIRAVEIEGASTPAIVPIAATIEPWIACCELQFNPYISYRSIEIPYFITITHYKAMMSMSFRSSPSPSYSFEGCSFSAIPFHFP